MHQVGALAWGSNSGDSDKLGVPPKSARQRQAVTSRKVLITHLFRAKPGADSAGCPWRSLSSVGNPTSRGLQGPIVRNFFVEKALRDCWLFLWEHRLAETATRVRQSHPIIAQWHKAGAVGTAGLALGQGWKAGEFEERCWQA